MIRCMSKSRMQMLERAFMELAEVFEEMAEADYHREWGEAMTTAANLVRAKMEELDIKDA